MRRRWLVGGCRRDRPNVTYSLQLMCTPDQEQLRVLRHVRQELVAVAQPLAELGGRVDRGIDFAPEGTLHLRGVLDHVTE